MSLPNAITARELIEIYFGSKIQIKAQESDVTVGTSVVKLGSYANIRTGIIISNSGSNVVALGFNNAVSATTGIQLAAGGTLSLTWLADGELATNDLWAISTASGNGVHVIESVLSGL